MLPQRYFDIFQEELDEFVLMWNLHRIRRSRNTFTLPGRPVVMYTQPHLFGTDERLVAVSDQSLRACSDLYINKPDLPCDEDVYYVCQHIMTDLAWSMPNDAEEASDLYVKIRNIVYNLL